MEQLELVALQPAAPPRSGYEILKVSELPDYKVSPPKSLLRSIKKWGVVEPIIVADRGDDGYAVLGGKRRLAAARLAGLKDIKAIVFDSEDIKGLEHVLGAHLNEERGPNRPENFEAVRHMIMDGHTIEQVALAISLTQPTVKFYAALMVVHPELLAAWQRGQISDSGVRLIARVPRGAQNRLVERAERGEVITRDAISEEWKKVDEVDGNLFDGDAVAEWTTSTINNIKVILESAPFKAPAIDHLKAALGTLQGELSAA